jgi:mono/diheme cytochrome c family protein
MRFLAITAILFACLSAGVAPRSDAAQESGAAPAAGEPSAPAPAEDADAAQSASVPEGQPASGNASKANGKPFDVKSSFRNICSFCHQDYGRHPGKGPQLMDSPRSDDFLFNRIKHGMTGRMPGFGTTFTDEQIRQMVKFIRTLKPGEEPKNPA